VISGRVGSLLEVATGFHPELTGRENIYLNGAILGMRRTEINRKFDEIVSFAEIEQFLDTPVKRYSSGMYVRLAFSVAAHLEPEILLVDEVLAVGDAAFQKKCIGKMGDVAQEGRTVLFVSHSMGSIQRLCSRSMLLDSGQLVANGNTDEVVNQYLSLFTYIASPSEWADLSHVPRQGNNEARFVKIRYSSMSEVQKNRAYSNGPLVFEIEIDADNPRPVSSIAVTLYDEFGTKLVNADTVSLDQIIHLKQGKNIVRFKIKQLYLAPGVYTLGCWLANPPSEVFDWFKSGVNIEVAGTGSNGSGIPSDGAVVCQFEVFSE
jgi:ABC-type multidrug transport system ATPase subunit